MTDLTFESTSRSIELEHGTVHYHEAGSGPTLLLMHGSGPGVTGWANYQDNLPQFAEHFHCLIVDFPGYGKSDPIEGDPISGCVVAIVSLLNSLNIETVHIIGNSLGGIIGSHIAARHPERVKRFVTIGGVGLNIFSAFPGEGLNLLTAFTEDPTRERVAEWLRSMVYDQSLVTQELIDARFKQATEPMTLETTKKLYSRQAINAIAEYRKGAGATQTLEHLSRIQAPTLITWGRDDRVSPMDIALIPMRIISNCELHVFPNCGHWAMIECKTQFESVVISFLLRQ
jgi:pimeloyl-ACP methyl ester carboxylesterase